MLLHSNFIRTTWNEKLIIPIPITFLNKKVTEPNISIMLLFYYHFPLTFFLRFIWVWNRLFFPDRVPKPRTTVIFYRLLMINPNKNLSVNFDLGCPFWTWNHGGGGGCSNINYDVNKPLLIMGNDLNCIYSLINIHEKQKNIK